jgi:hypothetical protein
MNAKLMAITGAVLGLGLMGAGVQTAKAGGLALNVSFGAPVVRQQAVVVQQPVCQPVVVQQPVAYQSVYPAGYQTVQQTVVYQQAQQVQQVPQAVIYQPVQYYTVPQQVVVQDSCGPVIVESSGVIYRQGGRGIEHPDFRRGEQVDFRFGFRH